MRTVLIRTGRDVTALPRDTQVSLTARNSSFEAGKPGLRGSRGCGEKLDTLLRAGCSLECTCQPRFAGKVLVKKLWPGS